MFLVVRSTWSLSTRPTVHGDYSLYDYQHKEKDFTFATGYIDGIWRADFGAYKEAEIEPKKLATWQRRTLLICCGAADLFPI